MLVGTLTMHIHLHGIGSLKDKRRIVKSLIERLKNRFNFSVAEVDAQESKQLAVIGIATVSNESIHITKQLDKAIEFARADPRFHLGQTEREIFSANS